MKTKNRKFKKRVLFDPDSIVTQMHQALGRDFREAQHVYCLNDHTTLYGFHRQVSEFTKKYCSQTQDKEVLEEQTFSKFEEINAHMGRVNERLDFSRIKDATRITPDMSKDERIHVRARAIVKFVLGPLSIEEWFSECRNSPGSTVGVSFEDTSIEAKFQLPMSVSESVVPLITSYLTWDRKLQEAVKVFNDSDALCLGWLDIVSGSRATTVDKTTEKRRMICIEPTANMYLQQGLMRVMYKRLKAVGLDVEFLPTLHQRLAKEASIHGLLSTIDWSSASDCVAVELLRWLLPPKWFDIVFKLRSSDTSLRGKNVRLQMISTMGNAVTFPLETLVFSAYAHATLTDKTRKYSLFPEWKQLKQCSVFGDDCIVPTSIAEEYISVMESVGFVVNKEKSYYGSERFRESCGGDYLAGYDVRPYTIRAPHSTKRSALEPWLYTVTNALLKKYMSYFGSTSYVYDKALWRVIFALFRQYKISIKLVPTFYPDDAGLKVGSDIHRFRNQYPMKLSRIYRDKHGSLAFNFCRFSYNKRKVVNDLLNYCVHLKHACNGDVIEEWEEDILYHPTHPATLLREVMDLKGLNGERHMFRPIKRKGGYVVGKAITSHWELPGITRAA